jgi:hypothetical protein
VKKIEEIRERKIEELKEKKLLSINFIISTIIFIVTLCIVVKLSEKIDKYTIEFCKNKTGIYVFPNCTETWFCFGVESTINCTEINEIVKEGNK